MKSRTSIEHMTASDWDLLADYIKSLDIDSRNSTKIANKFDIPATHVREFCRYHKIPLSKQQVVEYFLEEPANTLLTRKEIADACKCHISIVCRILSTRIYEKHDLSTGMLDYMTVQHVYDSKKKVLCRCTYCGTQTDILMNKIEYRPNGPWCSCSLATEYHKNKRKEATKAKYAARVFWNKDGHIRAQKAYDHWLKTGDTLRKSAETHHTSERMVHKYMKMLNLPHKHGHCE